MVIQNAKQLNSMTLNHVKYRKVFTVAGMLFFCALYSTKLLES